MFANWDHDNIFRASDFYHSDLFLYGYLGVFFLLSSKKHFYLGCLLLNIVNSEWIEEWQQRILHYGLILLGVLLRSSEVISSCFLLLVILHSPQNFPWVYLFFALYWLLDISFTDVKIFKCPNGIYIITVTLVFQSSMFIMLFFNKNALHSNW